MTPKQRQACLKKLADAQEKKRLNSLSECSCEVFMVPYMVGIQPKDFICFPSMNYEDPYIEDWEVTNVSYKQQGAAITLSISGNRPAPGGDQLITKEDLKKLEERVKSMKTPKQWENYYWSVVTPAPSPTSSSATTTASPSSSRYDTSQIDSI
jgi:hypothetical protein